MKPDHVTILIGVNDTWRGFDRNDPTTAEQFESNLRAVLERTVDETGAEIVLMMPFIVLGVQASSDVMLPDLEGKRAAVRKLAGEFGATLIDLQQVFDKAIADGIKPSALSADGVHPTDDCGHELIAKTWINTVL